jgi:ssDNA-specific exonuclease RecJ
MFDWDLSFKTCGDSLLISKATTKRDVGDRNIYKDDKKEIMKAATKYGYAVVWETNSIVRFARSS